MRLPGGAARRAGLPGHPRQFMRTVATATTGIVGGGRVAGGGARKRRRVPVRACVRVCVRGAAAEGERRRERGFQAANGGTGPVDSGFQHLGQRHPEPPASRRLLNAAVDRSSEQPLRERSTPPTDSCWRWCWWCWRWWWWCCCCRGLPAAAAAECELQAAGLTKDERDHH